MSLYSIGPRRDELIAHLRHNLNLTKADVMDEKLLEGAENTFMLARIEFGISLSQLWKELKLAVGLH